MPRIETKNAAGEPTGWLRPLWHVDGGPPIEQVYLTVVAPGATKGPHLHMKRRGLFYCIAGTALVTWRQDGQYHNVTLGPEHARERIEIPPGCPAAISNSGKQEAYVLNMPYPAWRQDDQDEWPVEEWNP